ncbi:MAG: T9SS type A sorting domain-containing protein [Elusimicrobiota bacterium]|nr:T9SS type A sorting domain-containing protein [Elusimicrobiota bacterium]
MGNTTYWLPDPAGNSKLEIEKNRVFNGKYSAYIYMYGNVVAETYVYQNIPVKSSTVYIGSGYFYDADFDYEVGYAYIEIRWFNRSGQQISYDRSLSNTTNSSNWQFLTTGNIISPSDAAIASVCVVVNKIRTSDFSKKVYIDDLSFNEVGEIKSSSITEPKNYPNPFNPRPPRLQKTEIVIPEGIEGSNLEIHIYSVSGDKIKTIYSSTWDGKDANNEYVQPGIYFYVIQTDKGSAKGKMTVIK